MEDPRKKAAGKRSRAAIMPYIGDPFLLNYWLKIFNQVWRDEIDRLYIYLNSPIESEVVQYITDLCNRNPKIHLVYLNTTIEPGGAINAVLDLVEEDFVMLIEEDALVVKQGVVDACFKKIEQEDYEVVGSKRENCSEDLIKQAYEKWGIEHPSFWPNFFFTRTRHLLATDRIFGFKLWHAGERIEPLDYVCENDQWTDVFANISLQLQAKFQGKIYYVPQFETEFLHNNHQFLNEASWIHINYLSNGIQHLLRDENNQPLSIRKDPDKKPTMPLTAFYGQLREDLWANKVFWWLTFYKNRETGKIVEFSKLYNYGINKLIEEYQLNREEIKSWETFYAGLGI